MTIDIFHFEKEMHLHKVLSSDISGSVGVTNKIILNPNFSASTFKAGELFTHPSFYPVIYPKKRIKANSFGTATPRGRAGTCSSTLLPTIDQRSRSTRMIDQRRIIDEILQPSGVRRKPTRGGGPRSRNGTKSWRNNSSSTMKTLPSDGGISLLELYVDCFWNVASQPLFKLLTHAIRHGVVISSMNCVLILFVLTTILSILVIRARLGLVCLSGWLLNQVSVISCSIPIFIPWNMLGTDYFMHLYIFVQFLHMQELDLRLSYTDSSTRPMVNWKTSRVISSLAVGADSSIN